MSRSTAQYGKENVRLVGKSSNKVVHKKPLLELPENIRIRSRSTSGLPAQPLPATRKVCSKSNLNQLCRNEIKAILQENPKGQQCLCPTKPTRHPKSADYASLEGKFDFENVDKRNMQAGPAHFVVDKAQRGIEQNARLGVEQMQRNTKVRRRNTGTNCVRRGSYQDDFYNREYIEDIIAILKKDEIRLIVRGNYVDNNILDSKMRTGVIDWMLSLQLDISFSESEFYLAVNLLDQVLSKVCVPGNLYQLLILTTIWIASKMIGYRSFTANKLIRYCRPLSYIPGELIIMEKKVLKILNYRIHTIEPTIITNYYLRLFCIDHIELARKSVYYVLDCATLLSAFSRYPISVVAAAAITVTIKFYFPEKEERIRRFLTQRLSVDYMSRKMCFESLLFTQVINMRNDAYEFRQPYYKYTMNNEVKGLV